MERKNLFTYFINLGSILYTCLSTFILLLSLVMAEGDSAKILVPSNFLYLLIFTFVLSLGSTLMRISTIPLPARYALHAICYIGGFVAFTLLCGLAIQASAIMGVIFAVIYLITSIIARIVKVKVFHNISSKKSPSVKKNTSDKTKKSSDSNEGYKNMFS